MLVHCRRYLQHEIHKYPNYIPIWRENILSNNTGGESELLDPEPSKLTTGPICLAREEEEASGVMLH